MSIGNYELEKEIHRGLKTSSFLARRKDEGGKTEYFLKRFAPVSTLPRGAAGRAGAEAFLEAYKQQRVAAAKSGGNWVRVHESGWVDEEKGEAYVVTDYYPQSLHKLIAGRVRLEPAVLFSMVRSILLGLKELETAAHRPHGDLTSNRVLFTSKKNLKRARALLTDPAPHPQRPEKDWHDLGALIYEAVLLRPYARGVAWPLRGAPEWNRLGPRGDEWRSFCSRLLNPKIRASVDDILRATTALKPPAGKKAARRALGAAAATVLALGLMTWAPITRNWPGVRFLHGSAVTLVNKAENLWHRPPPDYRAWRKLCDHHTHWFGPLIDDLSEQRRALWSHDNHLRDVLKIVDSAEAEGTTIDPRRLAGAPRAFPGQLKENPPESVQTPEVVAAIERALAVINRVGSALTADQWPARRRLERGIDDFRVREWDAAADYLISLNNAVPGPAAPRPNATAVDKILDLVTVLDKIEGAWSELQDHPDRGDITERLLREQENAASGPAAISRLAHELARAPDEEVETISVIPAVAPAGMPEAEEEKTEERQRMEALAEALAAEKDVSLTESTEINQFWRTQCAKLPATSDSEEEMREQAENLRRFLDDLDWLVPLAAPKGSERRPGPDAGEEIWKLREETLEQLLEIALASGTIPDQSAEEFLATGPAARTLRSYNEQRR